MVIRFPRDRKARRKDATKPHLVTGSVKNIDDAWNAVLERAGLSDDLHFHDLRQTFRSHMKMAGVDSFTLNEIDGHAYPPIERVYTQLDDEHSLKAIDRLPKWHKTDTSCAGQERRATLRIHAAH